LASKFFWLNGLKFCPRSLSLECDRLVLERLASLLLSGRSRRRGGLVRYSFDRLINSSRP
jgi:hypothetical protein